MMHSCTVGPPVLRAIPLLLALCCAQLTRNNNFSNVGLPMGCLQPAGSNLKPKTQFVRRGTRAGGMQLHTAGRSAASMQNFSRSVWL